VGFLILWYIFPIAAALGYLMQNTENKWASVLCAILIFFVPPFSPPTTSSVSAIALTQLTDSASLGVILIGLARSPTSIKWTALRNLFLGPFLVAVPFTILGPLLVYLFTCRVSLLVLAPALGSFALSQLTRRGRKPQSLIYVATASVVASMTAFNQPALDSYLSQKSPDSDSAGFTAFLLLFMVALLAGVMNLLLSAYRLGVSLTPNAFGFAIGGTILGRLAGRSFPLGRATRTVDTFYLVLLVGLSVIGFVYIIQWV